MACRLQPCVWPLGWPCRWAWLETVIVWIDSLKLGARGGQLVSLFCCSSACHVPLLTWFAHPGDADYPPVQRAKLPSGYLSLRKHSQNPQTFGHICLHGVEVADPLLVLQLRAGGLLLGLPSSPTWKKNQLFFCCKVTNKMTLILNILMVSDGFIKCK